MDFVFPTKFETTEYGSQDDGRLTSLNPREDTIPMFQLIPLVIDETTLQLKSRTVLQGITHNPNKDLVLFDRNTGAIELGKLSRGEYLPLESAIDLGPQSTSTIGNSVAFCKANHTHKIFSGAPITLAPDVTNDIGTLNAFSRADHKHNIPTDVPLTSATNIANTKGTSQAFSRADHKHKVDLGNYNVSLNDALSTTSGSYQALSGTTLYPQAGLYLAFAQTLSDNSTNGAYNYFTLRVGSNSVTGTGTNVRVTANRQNPWYATALINVDGFMSVDIGWARSTGTARCQYRSLTLLRVA